MRRGLVVAIVAAVAVVAFVVVARLGGSRAGGKRSAPAGASPPRAARQALACADLQGCVDGCRAGDAACVDGCVARLSTAARPYYEALQACVVPACADADAGAAPCREATSFGCKMCVMARCAGVASACLAH